MKFLFVCLLFGVFSATGWAQMDPSSLSLLGSSGGSTSTVSAPANADDGLETNRYVKKPKHIKKRAPASEDSDDADSNSADGTTGEKPAAVPDLQNAQVAPLPSVGGAPEDHEFDTSKVPQPQATDPDQQNLNFGKKMRNMLLGGDLDTIEKYRAFLDSHDIRKNVFEFSVATSYIYNTSLSPYYYRNYISSAPAADVGFDLWLTPFLGVDADYRTTFLDEVSDSPTQNNYVSDSQSWFGLGLKFRRFFGMALNSSSLTVGLRYMNYNFTVSPSSQSRMSVVNQGPELTADVSVPASRNYNWTFGVILDPVLTQTENAVGPNLASGASNQTVGMGVGLGGEYRMSRQTRAFYKFSALMYKSQYAGPTAATDPVTGVTGQNVPINNMFYMFDFGVHLGW